MSGAFKLEFAPLAAPTKGVLVLFCEEGLKFGSASRRAIEPTGDLVTRAAAADRFKGKNGSALDIVAPAGLAVSRLLVVGVQVRVVFTGQLPVGFLDILLCGVFT